MMPLSSLRKLRDYPRYGFELSLDKTWSGVSPSLCELIRPLPSLYVDCFRNPQHVELVLDRLVSGDTLSEALEVQLSSRFRRAQLTLVREQDVISGYLSPEPVFVAQERLLLQNQVSALYRSSRQMITIMDRQHRILDFNAMAAHAASLRFGHDMCQGECFTRYVQPDRIDDFKTSFIEVLSGKTVVKEREIGAPDGKSSLYEITYTPIYDADGQVHRVCFSGIDIEEKRKTRQLLEREQGFVSAILNTTNALIFATDTSGRVLRWNQACENLTGQTLLEIQNAPLFQSSVLAAEDQQKLRDIYRNEIGLPSYVLFSLCDKNQEIHPVSWSIQVSTGEGMPSLVVFTGLDLTQQRQIEDALEQSESLLRQAQKMEAVGISAGSIAHDFNNLLTAIQGYSELMALQKMPTESQTLNQALLSTCQKAKNLTRQLLMFSRRETEAQSIVDLAEVLESNAALFQQLAGSGVVLNYSAIVATPVLINRTQIEQVCLNLIMNACDAMGGNGLVRLSTFTVTLEKERNHRLFGNITPGVYGVLRVEDNGPGVNADALPHIFDPFFTTKPKERGTGLGLALVYRIVKKAGGWVNVKKAKGAVFEVHLPLSSRKPETLAPIKKSLHEIAFFNISDAVADRLSAYLRQEGFAVLSVQKPFSLDSKTLVMAPFSQVQNPQMKRFLSVLYLADEKDIESEAFAALEPHEDVLIRPFSEEQLKYRLLAMLR